MNNLLGPTRAHVYVGYMGEGKGYLPYISPIGQDAISIQCKPKELSHDMTKNEFSPKIPSNLD